MVQWLRQYAVNAGVPSFIPGQQTGFHMEQLSIGVTKLSSKIYTYMILILKQKMKEIL